MESKKEGKCKRGDLYQSVLSFLKKKKISTQEILTLFEAPKGSLLNYQTTISSGLAKIGKNQERQSNKFLLKEAQKLKDVFESKKQLYKCIENLKAQGLVKENNDKELVISPKGEKKRKELHEKRKLRFPSYAVEKDQDVKVISFDIPEKQRKQRLWIRSALKNLEFEMLHQSTWIGRSKLPEEFLDDLAFRGVFKYVTILVVTKAGNYKKLDIKKYKNPL